MANTHVFETKMSDRMQVTRYSTPIYAAQASYEERAKLSSGQSVTRPYVSRFTEQSYTRGVDMTIPDKVETNETLTVTTAKASPFRIDDLDAVQSNFRLMEEYSKKAMMSLEKAIDADYLAEVVDASSTVDAGDVGGVAGTGISLDTTNVLKVYSAALRKLQLKDVEITGGVDPRPQAGNMKPMGQGGFANVNPYFNEQLVLSLGGKESANGDQVGLNGYVSKYNGFDNYVTTNGTWVGTLGMAANPTAADTVTINGVVFTFADPLTGTAGQVLRGTNAGASLANLVALINAPGTTTTTGVALTAANQEKLKRVSAAVSGTNLVVTAKGYGYLVVSETLTDAGDVWSSEISKQMFGQKGATDMVLAIKPQVKVSDIPLQLGNYVKPHCLFGLETFTEGRDALVAVNIDSSSWV